MAKPKGSAKTGGRTAGTPNKVTSETKMAIQEIITSKSEKFNEILDKLSVEDPPLFAAIYCKLIPYVIPRLNAVDVNDTTKRDLDIEEKLKSMCGD